MAAGRFRVRLGLSPRRSSRGLQSQTFQDVTLPCYRQISTLTPSVLGRARVLLRRSSCVMHMLNATPRCADRVSLRCLRSGRCSIAMVAGASVASVARRPAARFARASKLIKQSWPISREIGCIDRPAEAPSSRVPYGSATNAPAASRQLLHNHGTATNPPAVRLLLMSSPRPR